MEETALALIESGLKSIDMGKIAEYSNKIGDITNLSHGAANLYLKDFIVAYDLAASAFAIATKCEIKAKDYLNMQEDIAYLDKAGAYLESKGIKDTDAARKRYVNIDSEVIKAKDVYAKAQAMTLLLKNKLASFRFTYEALKKMYFNNDNQMPWEGM